ncbi:MAG: hypothetical protein P8N63_03625 [Pseudomonadales bacterium]|nr:hypothetical protein [Pseudomonadales bacterium]
MDNDGPRNTVSVWQAFIGSVLVEKGCIQTGFDSNKGAEKSAGQQTCWLIVRTIIASQHRQANSTKSERH